VAEHRFIDVISEHLWQVGDGEGDKEGKAGGRREGEVEAAGRREGTFGAD